MSCGGNAMAQCQIRETDSNAATVRLIVEALDTVLQTITFTFYVARSDDDERSEDHRVNHSVQAKVDEAVNCHAGNSNQRRKACCPAKALGRLQVRACPLEDNDYKPDSYGQSDDAAAC